MKIAKRIGQFFLAHKKITASFIIILILLFAGWSIFGPKQTNSQYQTAQVSKDTLVVSVSESGQVSVANRTAVTTSATGVVTNVYVKEGDEVSVGQKIADIALDKNGQQQASNAYAQYLSAQNSVTNAQTQLNTLQDRKSVV